MSSSTGLGCIVKFPDPPTLINGKEPTYSAQSSYVQNKLQSNTDQFYQDDLDQEEDVKVVYIKIRIGGKAYNYLLPYLEVERDMEHNPTNKEVLEFLENVFKDLDCWIKAWQELKSLKMPYLGNFNNF